MNKEKEALDILNIIVDAPFILERLFELDKFSQEVKHRYLWGTITDEQVEKVKNWFNNQ